MSKLRERKNAASQRYKARLRGETVPYLSTPWTAREVLALAALYESGMLERDGRIQRLADSLGRSFSSVAHKAHKLGLTTSRDLSRSQPDSTRMAVSLSRASEKVANSNGGGGRGRGGRREDLGDRYFRSSWEANYARYLNFIGDKWEYEPKTFRFDGITRGTMSYTPDFWLPDRNEYHEVKGFMDQRSATQLARMKRYFPDVSVILVRKDWFANAHRQGLASVIPGWEAARL